MEDLTTSRNMQSGCHQKHKSLHPSTHKLEQPGSLITDFFAKISTWYASTPKCYVQSIMPALLPKVIQLHSEKAPGRLQDVQNRTRTGRGISITSPSHSGIGSATSGRWSPKAKEHSSSHLPRRSIESRNAGASQNLRPIILQYRSRAAGGMDLIVSFAGELFRRSTISQVNVIRCLAVTSRDVRRFNSTQILIPRSISAFNASKSTQRARPCLSSLPDR